MIGSEGFILIDKKSGLSKEFGAESEIRISTFDSRKRARYYIKKRADNNLLREFNKDMGGFIFAVFEMSKEFNRHAEVLTQADLSRLIVLGTYLNYNGVLIFDNARLVKKSNMNEILGLGKSAYTEFYTKLISLGILMVVEDKLYINRGYLFKGEIGRHRSTAVDKQYTRVYIDTVRALYNQTPSRSHKLLGMLFRLIPYINKEWNIVSHNPNETLLEAVKPMTLGELTTTLGYDSDNASKLKRDMLSITTKNGYRAVAFVQAEQDTRKMKIFVNPQVIYGGNDINKVCMLEKFCG